MFVGMSLLDFSKFIHKGQDKPLPPPMNPSKTWQGQQYHRRIQWAIIISHTAIPVSRSLKPIKGPCHGGAAKKQKSIPSAGKASTHMT